MMNNLYFLSLQSAILGNSLRQKAEGIAELLTWMDYDCPAEDKDAVFQSLDPRVKATLEELWGKFYDAPKNNGYWTGKEYNSVWIPDNDHTPPNTSYSNLYGLTWREIKQKYNTAGIEFNRGRVIFENIAIHSLSMPDFAEYINSNIRTGLHEEAFKRLSSKLGVSIERVRELKEGHPHGHHWKEYDKMEHKNYAWHEDINCETLYLVPQEIHGNIKHFGGVAMCKILRKHELL